MDKYNVQEVFDRYKENENLTEADIFHLYDTGEECIKNNTGYHDSRHFRLVGFNTETMEKCELGRHDGLESFSDNLCVRKVRFMLTVRFSFLYQDLQNFTYFNVCR